MLGLGLRWRLCGWMGGGNWVVRARAGLGLGSGLSVWPGGPE